MRGRSSSSRCRLCSPICLAHLSRLEPPFEARRLVGVVGMGDKEVVVVLEGGGGGGCGIVVNAGFRLEVRLDEDPASGFGLLLVMVCVVGVICSSAQVVMNRNAGRLDCTSYTHPRHACSECCTSISKLIDNSLTTTPPLRERYSLVPHTSYQPNQPSRPLLRLSCCSTNNSTPSSSKNFVCTPICSVHLSYHQRLRRRRNTPGDHCDSRSNLR